MSFLIHIIDEDRKDAEIYDFSFDPSETVKFALSRFLKTINSSPGLLSQGGLIFQYKNTIDLAHPDFFDKLLSSCVKEGSLIQMKMNTRFYEPQSIISMPDPKNKPKNIGFTPTAPIWRTIDKGLNVYGKCTCKKCEAKGQTVIDMKKKCKIDFCKSGFSCECPMCEGIIQPITIGFYMCKYKIFGQQMINDKIEKMELIDRESKDPHHCQFYDPQDGMNNFISFIVEITEIL